MPTTGMGPSPTLTQDLAPFGGTRGCRVLARFPTSKEALSDKSFVHMQFETGKVALFAEPSSQTDKRYQRSYARASLERAIVTTLPHLEESLFSIWLPLTRTPLEARSAAPRTNPLPVENGIRRQYSHHPPRGNGRKG